MVLLKFLNKHLPQCSYSELKGRALSSTGRYRPFTRDAKAVPSRYAVCAKINVRYETKRNGQFGFPRLLRREAIAVAKVRHNVSSLQPSQIACAAARRSSYYSRRLTELTFTSTLKLPSRTIEETEIGAVANVLSDFCIGAFEGKTHGFR